MFITVPDKFSDVSPWKSFDKYNGMPTPPSPPSTYMIPFEFYITLWYNSIHIDKYRIVGILHFYLITMKMPQLVPSVSTVLVDFYIHQKSAK